MGRRARKEKKSLGIRLFDGFDGDGNALRAFNDASREAVETNVVDAGVGEHFDGSHRVDRLKALEENDVQGRLFRGVRLLRD